MTQNLKDQTDPYREELRGYVKAGATLLDEKEPGWWRKIDLEVLDMRESWFLPGDSCGCVLAQLYWQYTKGLHVLGLNSIARQRFTYGFDVEGVGGRDGHPGYVVLDEEWEREIQERRDLNLTDQHEFNAS